VKRALLHALERVGYVIFGLAPVVALLVAVYYLL
jgi:hypothetical protein